MYTTLSLNEKEPETDAQEMDKVIDGKKPNPNLMNQNHDLMIHYNRYKKPKKPKPRAKPKTTLVKSVDEIRTVETVEQPEEVKEATS